MNPRNTGRTLDLLFVIERRGSVMVITSAWHAAGRWFDSRTRHVSLLGVKTWLSTGIVYLYHDSNVTWLPSRNKVFYFFIFIFYSMGNSVRSETNGPKFQNHPIST